MKLRLNVAYGTKRIFENFEAEFEDRTITCVMGASGVGKTTLLQEIARDDDNRKVSYVFQQPRLIPNLTIGQNLEFVLKDRYGKQARARAEKFAEEMKIAALLKRYPDQVSGGQAGRAALARAFAYESEILLMDEPFRGLDIGLKAEIMDTFSRMWDKRRPTVIFVTHDIDEALTLGDRIVLLRGQPAFIESDYRLTTPRTQRTPDTEERMRMHARIYRDLIRGGAANNEEERSD